jgi:hypothetical protein
LATVALLALTAALLVPAAGLAQTMPAPVDGAIERLKPGEYLWAPDVAPLGPVTMIVSLKTQRAYAYRNGVPIGVSTVSTGMPGHPTPTGIFTILQKAVDHKSNLYSDAPMPFMQRLTWSGIAMHAGKLPGYPASHGCIRLPPAFAKLLYGVTKLGLTVVITDDALVPEVAPTPSVLAKDVSNADQAPSDYSWHPERAPSGPISIVLSGQDRRIVVLRNGVEIGSGEVTIDGLVETTSAFTLRGIDWQGAHWLRLPLPGQAQTEAGELSRDESARAHLPPQFRALLTAILKPGATLLVTRDSLKSAGTGAHMTVITGDGP